MKALILAGGRGKRLEGVSQAINKCMLNLGGKPIIEHNLDNAVNAGVDEIVIVVGYKAEDVINRYGINYRGKTIKYVIQQEQKGLVHAIECAADALDGEDFFLMLGDELLINPKHHPMIDLFRSDGLFGVCGVFVQKNRALISKTYTLVEDGEHRIYRLIEKPRKALNDLMGTGNCIFKNEILSYIGRTPINQERGEKELPDLIQCAIDEGNVVKSCLICDNYFNVNSDDDLREAENCLNYRTPRIKLSLSKGEKYGKNKRR
ncbi:UTP--glucose-1-phosphate uridylyltransferase AglF [Candidatus Methanoperedenaceae archaeon GB50]|nr:MAG: UTP--glucose-1-phosphate uridylyltransferase AglF [Candidatus Methanoperedenaceae archaeon GB50]CAD7773308.1 UTP--glucose-1-phosphate uridylyltransferase AglF [Candidatus Methanoperedenaceae archaeon GB37]CAD7773408.1 UTP--glucose-1-phosphate uridylyltransferase AglF [Candidatus Methanoperedenaceae archaeon GB50]